MGFRFQRRLRIMPGLFVNLSKSGVSTSIGEHGATLNLSKRGARTTVGLPGTGMSYRSSTYPWSTQSDTAAATNTSEAPARIAPQSRGWSAWDIIALFVAGIMGFALISAVFNYVTG